MTAIRLDSIKGGVDDITGGLTVYEGCRAHLSSPLYFDFLEFLTVTGQQRAAENMSHHPESTFTDTDVSVSISCDSIVYGGYTALRR